MTLIQQDIVKSSLFSLAQEKLSQGHIWHNHCREANQNENSLALQMSKQEISGDIQIQNEEFFKVLDYHNYSELVYLDLLTVNSPLAE